MNIFHLSVVIFFIVTGAASSEVLIESNNIMNSGPIKIELNSQKAKVLIFLSANCGCTNSHITHLEALSSEYADYADFYGVLSNEEENVSDARAYFEKLKVNFPVIRSVLLAEKLKATHTPMAFVYSKTGTLEFSGGVSDSTDLSSAKEFYLKTVLESLRKNEKVPFSSKKVKGCAI